MHPPAMHPLHVSVLNLTVEEERAEMVLKTFVDDWETAFFHYTGKPVDFSAPRNYNGQWFGDYLHSSLKFSVNGKDNFLDVHRDSIWFEEQSMTIEMHVEYTEKPKSLYIYNTLLIDIFPDQSNLTILSYNQKEKGIKFDYHKREDLLKLR
jgi:hypothetical protein